MFIYNVTLKVDPSVESDWLNWMRHEHIPEVMETNLFLEHKMMQLIYSPFNDESLGNTFVVQYFFDEMAKYDQYQEIFAPSLQKNHIDRFGEKVLAFRTILKYI